MPASAAMDQRPVAPADGQAGVLAAKHDGGGDGGGNGGGWGHDGGNGGGNGNGWGHGGGNGRGHGNGNGGGGDSGGSSSPQASPSLSGNGGGNGNGHGWGHGNDGNGNGNGNGNGGETKHSTDKQSSSAATATATPTTSTSTSSSTPPPSNNSGATAATATPTGSVSPPVVPVAPTAPAGNGGRHTTGKHHSRHSTRNGRAGTKGAAGSSRPSARAGAAPGAATSPAALAAAAQSRKHGQGSKGGSGGGSQNNEPATVVRTLEHVVQVIPTFIKAVIVVLGALLVLAALSWFLLARTAHYLRRQRAQLLGEIGVLQGALLPNVPAELSRLEASVAYKPADGLAAGGDFYDAFPLDDGRVGVVVGDVAGHGKDALMHTALLRYTLRAYLEANLEPRAALGVAGRALDRGFDTLATVVLAVYDPIEHVLRYASAGHPPPVFLGEADHVPVTQASSPPIGAGLPTGLRQTTVWLPAGSAVCFFTDGLIEARREDALIGRLGLVDIIRELGPHATASQVLDRVSVEADRVDDDMAACMFRVSDGPPDPPSPRIEEIEVGRGEPLDATLGRFLTACGVEPARAADVIERTGRTVRQFRGAVVRVALPASGPQIDVAPANVESFASAEARRGAASFAARG